MLKQQFWVKSYKQMRGELDKKPHPSLRRWCIHLEGRERGVTRRTRGFQKPADLSQEVIDQLHRFIMKTLMFFPQTSTDGSLTLKSH